MALSPDQPQPQGAATTWRIDPAASRVAFAIRQSLAFVPRPTVVGRFADVSGTLVLDERRSATARIEVAVGAAGVDTGSARRDAHLQSAAFFDVARHPTLTFVSRMVEEVDRAGGRYRVMGDLTIRGVTRAVRLDLVLAHEQDATGWTRIVVTAETVINRRDYGLGWNGVLIRAADDVSLTLAIEAHPAAAAGQ